MSVTNLPDFNPPAQNSQSSNNAFYRWQPKRITLAANQSIVIYCPFNNSWGGTAIFLSSITNVIVQTSISDPLDIANFDESVADANVPIWFTETPALKMPFNHPISAIRLTTGATPITADIAP